MQLPLAYSANNSSTANSVVTIDNVEICYEQDAVGTTWSKSNTNNIVIYPNPSTGDLSIQWSSDLIGIDRVNIVDITGKKIWSQLLDKNVNPSQIKVEGIALGIYFVELISENRIIATKKLIKN